MLQGIIAIHGSGQPWFEIAPLAHAYPSIYAGLSFSFVFSLIGHAFFPLSYAIGLLMSWTWVQDGSQSWFDIGVGIAIAGLGYGMAETIVVGQRNVFCSSDEGFRKAIHASIGLLLCLMIWFLGVELAQRFALLVAYTGILIIHLILAGIRLPGVDKLLGRLERRGAIPGEGAMYYALGALFALGLLRGDSAAAVSVILILAVGDSLATLVGNAWGRHKLPWNENKTVEGSMGFAAGAMCALFVLPIPTTILAIVVGTAVESLSKRLNDNITVPVICSLLYYLLLN